MILQKARGLLPFATRVCLTFLLATVWGSGAALAQRPCPSGANDIPTLQCAEGIFNNLLKGVLALAGVLAFISLVAGGFKYLTAGGDAKAVAEAQRAITLAVGGLVLVVAAWSLLAILSHFLYGDIYTIFNFTIPGPWPGGP